MAGDGRRLGRGGTAACPADSIARRRAGGNMTEDENETQDDAQDGIVLGIQESRSIPEGTHSGRIQNVSTRQTDFGPYVDLEIGILDVSDETPTLLGSDTVGFPAKLTPNSWLGQLVAKFGVDLENPGGEIDVAELLEEQAVQFETEDEKTEHGNFARIEKQSVRPHPTLDHDDVWGMGDE